MRSPEEVIKEPESREEYGGFGKADRPLFNETECVFGKIKMFWK